MVYCQSNKHKHVQHKNVLYVVVLGLVLCMWSVLILLQLLIVLNAIIVIFIIIHIFLFTYSIILMTVQYINLFLMLVLFCETACS